MANPMDIPEQIEPNYPIAADDWPTWIDGIGPPLEQLEEDHSSDDHVTNRDVLALIREVKRLRGALEELRKLQEALIEARAHLLVDEPSEALVWIESVIDPKWERV